MAGARRQVRPEGARVTGTETEDASQRFFSAAMNKKAQGDAKVGNEEKSGFFQKPRSSQLGQLGE